MPPSSSSASPRISPIIVALTPSEMSVASHVGGMRHICAIRDGKKDANGLGADADGWGLHVEGVAGEIAAAKALGVYWMPTVNTYKSGGDLGDLVQVRTRSRHDYDLLVRDQDRDEDLFVLVTGKAPQLHVQGWIRGGDAKQDRFRQSYGNRTPAYFLPKAHLRPLHDLRKLLQETRDAAMAA